MILRQFRKFSHKNTADFDVQRQRVPSFTHVGLKHHGLSDLPFNLSPSPLSISSLLLSFSSAKSADSGGKSPTSPSSAAAAPSAKDGGGGAAAKKTLTRVEILKIAEPCPLIDPSQVVITQGEVLVADPVMTPIGSTGGRGYADRLKNGCKIQKKSLFRKDRSRTSWIFIICNHF